MSDERRRPRLDSRPLACSVLGAMSLFAQISAAGTLASKPDCSTGELSQNVLSLKSAVELALCANADIQYATASIQNRAAQRGQALAAYWPALTASSSMLYQEREFDEQEGHAITDSAMTVYAGLTWTLFDFGKRRADAEVTSSLLAAAFATRDATVQKVLARVVETYFDAISAKALLDSRIEDEVLAQQTLASAERRVAQGDGAQSDRLQAQTELARSGLELNRARTDHEKSLAVLAQTIGLSPGISFGVSDEIRAPRVPHEKALAAWLDEARARHPAIVAARRDVDAAMAQVKSARSSGKPTLELQTNYYMNGFPQQGLDDTRQRNTTVGLSVKIPLFDGFLTRYRLREAQASLTQKQTLLIDAELVTLTEIISAYHDASAAAANLRHAEKLQSAALEAQASSARRYESGATDIVELLSAQRALADARQESVRSIADWRSTQLRLLAISGLLETGGAL